MFSKKKWRKYLLMFSCLDLFRNLKFTKRLLQSLPQVVASNTCMIRNNDIFRACDLFFHSKMKLPSEIIVDILSRLPIKTITTCKSVCKKWLKLISTPEFAKFHLLIPSLGLIVYLTQRNESQCTIYEFQDVLGLQCHDLHYKLLMKFDPNILSSSIEANIGIECSVNGLLCLKDSGNKLDALFICNPITHEYFPLPTLHGKAVTYGIGISMFSCQYKVVRISHELANGLKAVCMVYTLGTGSWRSIEINKAYDYSAGTPNGTFLNGSLHWLVKDKCGFQTVSCFDLERELYKPFSSPPLSTFQIMTVVRECLCLCDYGSDEKIVIWMMKEYGVDGSWAKEFVFGLYPEFDGMPYETVRALKVFKDGDVLMLQENTCLFYYRKETRTYREVDVFGREQYGWINARAFTPSFLSLRSFELENVSSF